jgi:hypothetical protein
MNQDIKGLGDIVAKITQATKLDQVAKGIATAMGKDDCGCEARQEALNKMFPINQDKK